MTVRASLPFAGVGLFVLLVSCSDGALPFEPKGCTLLGCNDGLTVDLQAPAAWPAGTYRFELDADGATQTCEATIPLPPCDTQGIQCTGDHARVSVSGCALPPSAQGFGPITFWKGPSTAVVRIFKGDGTKIADGTFHPTYALSRPNGPECEPECRSAPSERLAVDL